MSSQVSPAWLILIYKLPSEPSRLRVAVWREIRKLGGVYLQDGVCAFPATLDMDLNVEGMRERIVDAGGTGWLFEAGKPWGTAQDELRAMFDEARFEEYRPVAAGLNRILRHLAKAADHWELTATELNDIRAEFSRLRQQARAIAARDYFNSPAGQAVRSLIQECEATLMERGRTSWSG
ncbi:MAG: Chromate resistance protein ChrB [Bacillota bacterium]